MYKADENCDRICPVCGHKLVFDEEIGVCYCPVEYCSFKCAKCSQNK